MAASLQMHGWMLPGQQHSLAPVRRLPRAPGRACGPSMPCRQPCSVVRVKPSDSYDPSDPFAPIVSNSEGSFSSQKDSGLYTTPAPQSWNWLDREQQRRKWRTVYDFPQWWRHRSPTRFVDRLLKIYRSQVLLNSLPSIAWVMGVATCVAGYMTLYDAHLLPEVFPSLEPNATASAFINETSVALSLLLVFRTDESYSRWNEAREAWGDLLSRCRDLMRQGCTYFPPDAVESRRALARWIVALARTMRIHFQPEVTLESELTTVLHPLELEMIVGSQHRPMRAIHAISAVIMQVRMSDEHQANMEDNVSEFHDILGNCERILRAPIPVSFTRHTARFLMVWLSALPFALYGECGWGVVPVAGGIAAVLCGIEEIGIQCEEPFGVLPLEVICNRISADVLSTLEDYEETVRIVTQTINYPTSMSNVPASSGPGSRSSGNADDGYGSNGNGGSGYGGGGGSGGGGPGPLGGGAGTGGLSSCAAAPGDVRVGVAATGYDDATGLAGSSGGSSSSGSTSKVAVEDAEAVIATISSATAASLALGYHGPAAKAAAKESGNGAQQRQVVGHALGTPVVGTPPELAPGQAPGHQPAKARRQTLVLPKVLASAAGQPASAASSEPPAQAQPHLRQQQ